MTNELNNNMEDDLLLIKKEEMVVDKPFESVMESMDTSTEKVNQVQALLNEINPLNKRKSHANKNDVDADADAKDAQTKESFTPFQPYEMKSMDDYIFQFFLGTISVTGLFILFRMIQRSK